ncbi:MAG: HD domain-containing protein [Fimbriimonadaceae bacterium]|nr:HD domain-containing protein [Fimbriimonadaceae bacterium]QYK56760.1 MAG: HD domain-containing protein [Fimbriimonadaceae bacterium]
MTLKEVKANPQVRHLIDGANALLSSMGYTEHGHRHVGIVSSITRYILENIGVPDREVELGMIAGYLHDIGNVINRHDHPISGANIAYNILNGMGMPPEDIAPILGAIGNHEELLGTPTSTIGAALIIADKSDVHRSRVQNPIMESFDIHDRVNYAVTKSRVEMNQETKVIGLVLELDSQFASVMEFFEIFLSRMVMCRKSAAIFGYRFTLSANETLLE